MATENKKLITTPTLVLMIISTIYGFGNVSIAYAQMAYAGMFWYVLAGICFFFPCCLMMAEYGSAFDEAKGGIYSWLAGSIGEKLAFIGTFIWLASWVLWLVSSASRLWITLSALLFGKDTTQSWHLGSLGSTQLIGVLAILFILLVTWLSSRGINGITKISSFGGAFMIAMNGIFIIASLITIIANKGVPAQPIEGIKTFFTSPNPSFQTPIAVISFIVYAVFAYAGMENLGGVTDSMENPSKTFPKGLTIGAILTISSYVLMIVMTGFSVNYKQVIARPDVNLGNVTYVVFNQLGYMMGASLGFSHATNILLGEIFTRLIALAGMMGMLGAMFILVYTPIKSFIMGSNPDFWPKRVTRLNKYSMPAFAMWAQAIIVSIIIFLVAFGGSAAANFYLILTDMGNVSTCAPYIFLVGAFPAFQRKDIPRDFIAFKNRRWTTVLVWFVEIIVCLGILFTCIQPILDHDYQTAFWTAFGPIFFGIVALLMYNHATKRKEAAKE
ncbi:glutamate/gamma-aminobutyrate family transporter YjeM [Lactobacillaceae bacterium 24-114]